MADIARLSVEDARRETVAGRALLVCAYGDERCREVALEGSIPLSALAARAGTLPRDRCSQEPVRRHRSLPWVQHSVGEPLRARHPAARRLG